MFLFHVSLFLLSKNQALVVVLFIFASEESRCAAGAHAAPAAFMAAWLHARPRVPAAARRTARRGIYEKKKRMNKWKRERERKTKKKKEERREKKKK